MASPGWCQTGGNWGYHPYFFLKKNWRPSFFAHHCHLYWFHSGVTPSPGGCHPAPFLPVRPRLSTILCKFCSHFFSFGCHPPGGCHPGRSPLVRRWLCHSTNEPNDYRRNHFLTDKSIPKESTSAAANSIRIRISELPCPKICLWWIFTKTRSVL